MRPRGGYIGFNHTATTAAASGVWTLREAEALKRAGTWPLSSNDPNFSSVSLLLHFEGTNGSTTFTDTSPTPKTVTAVGNAQISTAQSKFGGASGLFDGAGDYLSIGHSTGLAFGSDSFTVEMWVYPTTIASAQTLYGKRANSGTFAGFNAYIAANTLSIQLVVNFTGGGNSWGILQASSNAMTLNAWNHVAMVRNGNQWDVYINGTSGLSVTNSGTVYDDGSAATIGAVLDSAFPFTGHIDEFRITKGVARYTANFTAPTAPFPDE